MEKIKVLQIVGSLRIGGAENVAMNIYRYINRDKYEFHYLVYGKEIGDYEREVETMGGKVIHISYKPKVIDLEYRKTLEKIIEKNGPYDIVHAHMMFHNGKIFSSLKKYNIPLKISHAHSTDDGSEKNNLLRKLIRKVYTYVERRNILKYANCYIACGDKAGEYLYGKKLYHSQGILVRNGINIEEYTFNSNNRKFLRNLYGLENNIVIAIIGHLEMVKNHSYAIKIFKNIHDKIPNSRLLIFGEGKLKNNLQQQIFDNNLQDVTKFMGNVNNVNEWLQAIDILLMPSLFEGVPLTLIEAQTAGVRCFVSENISKEVKITDLLTFISIEEENIQEWTNAVVSCRLEYNRNLYSKKVIEKGYGIDENIDIIKRIYNFIGDKDE
ncbi:glycosyltransferase [Ligilactobacillus sp. Marseille-Q7487]|uniref:glycosyltransferase n=1 Tax=Ligilactobacillus sp. Marseille-Q7487 TaxID=3022128 RepID=UPI0024A8E110|nr:glycosyltransferase [Ligilactobacillus sp. Marseille-Q7487]